ncbi:MAG TPA: squalene--hopene cyclase [Candidatus Wujingus californicus]|uniref:squalene--hopene cyclase n=1 Tax=Candidatus Wujingus californicus TaxID=3367618 RepID=UPI001DFA1881|nr:squalene--hopene cyclase [Planctomycetota bacterium]MDO8130538.1 squalene--hopene cyclase [Candidatus Brocadiales bacterium]
MRNFFTNFLQRLETNFYKFNGNGNGKRPVPELPKSGLRFESLSLDNPPSTTLESKTQIDIAISRAQQYILGEQGESDGHWVGILEADTTVTSDYIMLTHFLGKVDKEKQQKAANLILRHQLSDGGWNIYYGGPSEISASVKAYFALKLAGYSANEPFMQKAKKRILDMGGIMKTNCFTKIYLAMFGQVDWRAVPAVPAEMILFPPGFYFSIYEMSYWSRCIVVPLSIAIDRKPRIPVGDYLIQELYLIPRDKVFYRIKRDDSLFSWRNFFIDADSIFRRYEQHPIKFIRKIALKRAEKWMLEHMEKSGGTGAIWPSIINSIFAMKCLGYPDDHPAMLSQLKAVEALVVYEGDKLYLQPCVSPVWDTAWAVIALHESGIPSTHPALQKAGQWLISKEVRNFGDWALKCKVEEPSGWYFQYANEFFPDTDDSAAVLMALQRVSLSESSNKEKAFLRGLRWIQAMQCDDGGWGAFDRNNNKTLLNYIPFADFNALLDPSTSDVTARCIDFLGCIGFSRTYKNVKKAIEFLKKEQERDGSWLGRWGANYIYGTWSVLSGLTSVGENANEPYIKKAAEWLKSVQNADGGWGETIKSYDDPSLRAVGNSTSSQTAWALMALFYAGEVSCNAVKRGIEFLLTKQNEDGSWDENEFTATGFPKVFYLKYHMYRNYFPLYALGKYRNLIQKL